MTLPAPVAFGLVVVTAAVDWHAAFHGLRRLESFTRPLVSGCLALVAIALGGASGGIGLILLIGALLAVVADICSAFGGVSAFALAVLTRLLSVASLDVGIALVQPRSGWAAAAALLPVVALMLTAGRRVVRAASAEGGTGLALSLCAFGVAAGLLPVVSAATLDPWVILGSVLMTVSFLVIGADRFLGTRPRARFVVAASGQVGMALILWGALG